MKIVLQIAAKCPNSFQFKSGPCRQLPRRRTGE